MKFEFVIPGEPQGKGRPRVTTIAGHARAYTPDKTVSYESLIKWCWAQQYGNINPSTVPIRMHINAYYTIPASDSKNKRAAKLAGSIYPTKKVDADNLAKIVADSLNGLAYCDDVQIVDMHVYKRYGDQPRVDVTVEEVE